MAAAFCRHVARSCWPNTYAPNVNRDCRRVDCLIDARVGSAGEDCCCCHVGCSSEGYCCHRVGWHSAEGWRPAWQRRRLFETLQRMILQEAPPSALSQQVVASQLPHRQTTQACAVWRADRQRMCAPRLAFLLFRKPRPATTRSADPARRKLKTLTRQTSHLPPRARAPWPGCTPASDHAPPAGPIMSMHATTPPRQRQARF